MKWKLAFGVNCQRCCDTNRTIRKNSHKLIVITLFDLANHPICDYN